MTRSLALACLVSCAAGTMPGCASGDVRTATLGEPMSLPVGERVSLPGDAALRYVGVTADSRCPPGVQCIRAGDADVAFEFTPAGGAPVAVNVNIPESPAAAVGEWQLRLLSLEFGDAPAATVQVDPAD
ncbi:MAG: hypothetical protein ACREPV_12840 [Lysobacter sp.]